MKLTPIYFEEETINKIKEQVIEEDGNISAIIRKYVKEGLVRRKRDKEKNNVCSRCRGLLKHE